MAQKVNHVKRLVAKEVIPFTRQVASMFGAGMAILSVMQTLRDQCADPDFKGVLQHLCNTIESGAPLSKGIADYPQLFDEMYVNMIVAGEQSGQFDAVLKRLAMILLSGARLQRKVKSAMTYPKVVVTLALSLSFGLIQFVVPIFADMFSGMGKELPGLTQLMVNIADFVKGNWYFIVVGVGLFVWGFRRWRATERGHFIFDEWKLRIPVFGLLSQKVAIARFCRLMAQMNSAGVPILKALKVVAGSIGNRVYEKSILAARQEVEQGNQVSPSLEGKPYMPILMVRMLSAGEKSGREREMFDSVADTYEDEVETMLSMLTALMEPFLIVVLGAIIGTIVMAMFLPIFKLGSLAM